MLRRLLALIQGAILNRPVPVLIVSGAVVLAAIAFGFGVEFRTSRAELAPPDDPEQQKLDRLVREAGGDRALIAFIEPDGSDGVDPARLRAFADRLAVELAADPLAGSVFHKIPLEWFLERALYLAPPADLREQLDRFEGGGALNALGGIASLTALNDAVAEGMEQARRRSSSAGEDAARGVEGLVRLLEAERRLLTEPGAFLEDLEREPPLAALAGRHRALESQGYLATRDGSSLFVIVSAAAEDDELPTLRAFVSAMRTVAQRVIRDSPGFRVAFTGQPAMTVEEMDTIRRDTALSSIVAMLGVTGLTFLVFRWRGHVLLVMGALIGGVLAAFGWVGLRYGYLNMITSSFISTLIGVGVAYGIHPVSEYELEGAHTRDPRAAVREAYHRTGVPVTVAAITTSAAFLSIQLMRFRGFAELGAVAGVGVLLCLIASLVTLPAIVVVYGRWRHRRDRTHRASAVDRFWVERAAARICRAPRRVLAAAAVVTLALGWFAWGNEGFNTNMLDLLPRNSEALQYQQRMMMQSDLSAVAAVVAAPGTEELRVLRGRAEAEPAIVRFESALQFLPADMDASRSLVERVGALLDAVSLPAAAEPLEAASLESSAWRLEEALAWAAEDAFGAGLAELAGTLEEARALAEELAGLAASATPARLDAWNGAQRRLLEWVQALAGDLRRATRVEPPSIETLPNELRRRFLTSDGRLLAYLQPRGSVFDADVLEDYVAACRRVSESAFGFPIVFHRVANQITSGFYNAVALGAVLVFLILLVDYRNLRDAGLAMIPLAIGMVWMLGWMGVCGISFNFANLVAVPLIIGVGIDNGVHVVHRLRLEGAEGMGVVLRHTGRAILIASLTTMIGFGSLALASHRGLESLGLVLLLGVGSCLITSTVVLPNLLVAFGATRR